MEVCQYSGQQRVLIIVNVVRRHGVHPDCEWCREGVVMASLRIQHHWCIEFTVIIPVYSHHIQFTVSILSLQYQLHNQ
jgi:hypothetical protein